MPQGSMLTAIIPVTSMNGKLEHFKSTVSQCKNSSVKLVVVHDHRDDATGFELKNLLKSNGPGDAIFIENKFGSAALARNAGLAASQSRWVCFWDCDDTIYVEKFLEMIKYADSNQSEIAIGRISVSPFNSTGSQVASDELISNKNFDLQISNFPAFTRMGFKRSLLQANPFPDLPLGEDLVFLLKQNLPEKKISILNQVVYCYHVGDSNQSTRRHNDQRNLTELLSNIEMMLRSSSPKAIRMNLAFADKLLLSLIRRATSEKLTKQTLKLMGQVILHNLKSPKTTTQILLYFLKNRSAVIRALHGK